MHSRSFCVFVLLVSLPDEKSLLRECDRDSCHARAELDAVLSMNCVISFACTPKWCPCAHLHTHVPSKSRLAVAAHRSCPPAHTTSRYCHRAQMRKLSCDAMVFLLPLRALIPARFASFRHKKLCTGTSNPRTFWSTLLGRSSCATLVSAHSCNSQ